MHPLISESTIWPAALTYRNVHVLLTVKLIASTTSKKTSFLRCLIPSGLQDTALVSVLSPLLFVATAA